MHRYTRLLLTSLSAAAVFAIAVSSASANNLSNSNRNIKVTWASLEFSNSINENTVRCPVTLEGSFSSATIRKVIHALIGRISVGIINNNACTGGHATIHQTSLPWHQTYEGFIGRLPNITGVRQALFNSRYEIEAGIKCTVTNDAENPAYGIAVVNSTTGAVEGLRADESSSIALEGLCGFFARGIFKGTATVRLLGTTNVISVKLI